MPQLRNNGELIQFLQGLSVDLLALGEHELAAAIERVKGFETGSPSELLHEARLALDLVAKSGVKLSAQEHQEVLEAIGKIDEAFAAVGGA